MDSGIKIKEAVSQFTKIKAQLNRLVASQEEIIEEMQENCPVLVSALSDYPMNLKVKILEKAAPLLLRFQYPDNPTLKSVQVYLSHTVKEPSRA
jgi:hypothetical protein